MILSATFDEQILKQLSIDEWLHYCKKQHVQSLEFSPDPSVLPFEVYKRLLNKQRSLDISTTFHVPYFAKSVDPYAEAYDLAYARLSPLDFKDKYTQLFQYIDALEQPSILTLHGAKRLKTDGENACLTSKDNTWFALEKLLNDVNRYALPLTLCIELSGSESPTYLTTREEVLETIEKFAGAPLKICWDITHDYALNPSKEKPSEKFIKHIEHVHIHGISDQKKKHFDLEKSSVNFDSAIEILHEISYKNAIVLEILMHTVANPKNYLKSLKNDLHLLTNLIK